MARYLARLDGFLTEAGLSQGSLLQKTASLKAFKQLQQLPFQRADCCAK